MTAIDSEPDKPLGEEDGSRLAADIESLGNRLQEVRAAIGQVIFGQKEVIDEALITILAGGHALLVRAPAEVRAAVPVFQPQAEALARLTARLKESFDPRRVLNPGRMYAGL